ncbi:MAG: hypothetical protein KC912_09085 [Proteobacteria bacterium]|nr:hypothetical protein [Pseudomonadota bacterium]
MTKLYTAAAASLFVAFALGCGAGSATSKISGRLEVAFAAGILQDKTGLTLKAIDCEVHGGDAFSCTLEITDRDQVELIAKSMGLSLLPDGSSLAPTPGHCVPTEAATHWYSPEQGDGHGAWWLHDQGGTTLCATAEHIDL